MNQLEDCIKQTYPEWSEEFPGALNTIVNVLGLTEDIAFDFQGDENPMLLELREFWKAYGKVSGAKVAKLAVEWYEDTSHHITNEWTQAVADVLLPFRQPAKLPRNMMTEEEKEALEAEDSPLPENASNS